MGMRLEKLRQERERVIRIALIGAVVGGLVAYPLLVYAKFAWDLPHRGWGWVAAAPLIGLGIPVAMIWFLSGRDLEVARRLDELE